MKWAPEYTAMLLGATGNVGGHILPLLVQSPLCKKVVVVTRRNVSAAFFAIRCKAALCASNRAIASCCV